MMAGAYLVAGAAIDITIETVQLQIDQSVANQS